MRSQPGRDAYVLELNAIESQMANHESVEELKNSGDRILGLIANVGPYTLTMESHFLAPNDTNSSFAIRCLNRSNRGCCLTNENF